VDCLVDLKEMAIQKSVLKSGIISGGVEEVLRTTEKPVKVTYAQAAASHPLSFESVLSLPDTDCLKDRPCYCRTDPKPNLEKSPKKSPSDLRRDWKREDASPDPESCHENLDVDISEHIRN
jgi:hypothetical protein